jgi:hypothetical protein
VARMGVWGKGRQSLAPPQHTEFPEREQRFGLTEDIATSQRPLPDQKRYAVFSGLFCGRNEVVGLIAT